jgi:hypothetical protein
MVTALYSKRLAIKVIILQTKGIYHKNTLDMGWTSPQFITLNDTKAEFIKKRTL